MPAPKSDKPKRVYKKKAVPKKADLEKTIIVEPDLDLEIAGSLTYKESLELVKENIKLKDLAEKWKERYELSEAYYKDKILPIVKKDFRWVDTLKTPVKWVLLAAVVLIVLGPCVAVKVKNKQIDKLEEKTEAKIVAAEENKQRADSMQVELKEAVKILDTVQLLAGIAKEERIRVDNDGEKKREVSDKETADVIKKIKNATGDQRDEILEYLFKRRKQ